MANQIVVSAGAKVRNLQDVIIGTSGVLTSLGFDVANGVPRLDVNGKILVSQLPNSVMEYKGTWDASTNTPTLVNGTGNQGDVYLCNVAGTVNFGAGPIAFVVGDQVIYSGSIWQRASGATGTVTSVAITESGDSLNITGSPITTSGTINIGFNGTNLQYVNGAGNLTTFPTLITSIGLSMPSAFSVANSPLTANGTIAVTGAGTTAQYIRGDGSLATFPTIATEAQRLITEVYNETGATLTKGTVVYINGGHGNLPTITKAIATGDATSAQTYGIVQTDITNNNNGYVVVIGSLGDLDTQAYANGTQLYLSSTVAGQWTSTKQYAPAHLVYVAIVTRSHPTQGVVEVRIQNGFEMDELHNVSAQTPSNNQGLFYNTSTSLWENKSIATALGYTPANDALVVHLAGTETITGIKTFSNGLNSDYIGVTGDIGMDGSFSLKQVAFGTLQSGYTNLSGQTNGLRVGLFGGYNALLNFSTSGSYTYTFPNATGTIALTSDIPSLAGYVTLGTTQTITGAKTFSAYTTFTSTVDITSGLTFSNSGFTLVLQPPTLSVNRTVTFPNATGTIALTSDIPSITGLVPYTGATGDVNLGLYSLTSNAIKVIGDNSTYGGTLSIKQSNVTNLIGVGYTELFGKTNRLGISFGAGSIAYLSNSTLTAERTYTLPDATGTIALVGGSGVGTVTSVAALTIGTTGTDLSSSVANSTTTPVITLNVPTASATNRGALSSADWSTFNNKQSALTNPVTGTGFTNYLPKFTGTSTIGNSLVYDNGNGVAINGINISYAATGRGNITINGTSGIIGFNNSGTAMGYFFHDGTNMQMWNEKNGELIFGTNALTKMRIDASGNLGLGVTPSAWFVVHKVMQLGGNFSGTAYAGAFTAQTNDNVINLFNNAYVNSSNVETYYATAEAAKYRINRNSHEWYNAPSGTAGAAITFTQAMTLTASGSLGIGTPTPSTLLHIASSSASFFTIDAGTSSNSGVSFYRAGSPFGAIYYLSTNTMRFDVNNAIAMLIDSSANTSIGYTTNPSLYKLDVNGTGRFSGNLAITAASGAVSLTLLTGTSYGYFYNDGTNIGLASNLGSTGLKLIVSRSAPDSSLVIASTGAATFSSSVTAGGVLTINATSNSDWAAGINNLGTTSANGLYVNIGASSTGKPFAVYKNFSQLFGVENSGAATFSSTCTATGFFESSDMRIKTLIQDNYQTKGIASITPKLYTKNGKVELGYYAQDFVGILDSAVSKGSDDMLSLSYREVLVAKVYALEQEIKELKAK